MGNLSTEKNLMLPLTRKEAAALRCGDRVFLTGTVYTARDAAHKRMQQALDAGEELPVDLSGQVLYYMGPSPAREGRPIGSAGPTTSSRMDRYTPALLDRGLLGMIGKGRRSQPVREAIVRNGAVYFATIGGAGALLSKAVRSCQAVAYEDLGPEAIYRLEVDHFFAIVAIDALGNDLYGAPAGASQG